MKGSLIFILIVLIVFPIYSQKQLDVKQEIFDNSNRTHLNINNISTWFYNNGISDIDPSGKSGLIIPKGSGKGAVFTSGLIWGALVPEDPQPRVGGTAYRTGLQPGKIGANGFPEDPYFPKNRIYRVRNDVFPGSSDVNLISEIDDGEGDYFSIKDQYETDWNEWPANEGAPFTDQNLNGIYEPAIDIPGVTGADQTIWFVANDLDPNNTTFLYGAQPLGIELQVTIWGYRNPLYSNVFFRKYKLFNKSKTVFNDMYLSMWSDPDIGNSTNDFVGCDTLLNLGFAYNATDKDGIYNSHSPSIGFNLLNQKMSAFYYFTRGDNAVFDPVQGDISGSTQFYNYMQGKVGLTGNYFTNPITGLNTPYSLSGDPITNKGWNDGQIIPAGDRRLGLSSGPFNIQIGESKEIVIAEFAAFGKDRINSIVQLKKQNDLIKKLYDSGFHINAVPTEPPPVQIMAEYDDYINLSWENSSENFSLNGYSFQGYNLYQLPDDLPFKEVGKKIATFDIVDGVTTILHNSDTLQTGNDTGIKRNFIVMQDALTDYNLIRGKRYYFAISAYTYNSNTEVVQSSESLLKIVAITFQDTIPGPHYGNNMAVLHLSGKSDGFIKPVVYDPSILTGHNYQVYFSIGSDDSLKWNLKDLNNNTILLSDQSNFMLNENYPLVDGFSLAVFSPNPGIKKDDSFSTDDSSKWGWDIPKGTRRFTWSGANGLEFEGFQQAIGWASPGSVFGGLDPGVPEDQLKNVLLILASVTDSTIEFDPVFDVNDPNLSYGYRYGRGFGNPPFKPEFAPYIINTGGAYSFQKFEKNVPLSAWDIEDPINPRRLAVGFLENNSANGLVDGKYWPGDHTKYDNTDASGPREWLWIFDADYAEIPNSEFQVDALNNPLPIMYFSTVNRLGSAPFSPGRTGEDYFALYHSNPLTEKDVFTFNSNIITSIKPELVQNDFTLNQNYPNPFNPLTIISYSIPIQQLVTLKVYDVLGREVTTLVNEAKTAGSYKVEFNGSSLSSGVYFYRIQAGKFIDTKKFILLK